MKANENYKEQASTFIDIQKESIKESMLTIEYMERMQKMYKRRIELERKQVILDEEQIEIHEAILKDLER